MQVKWIPIWKKAPFIRLLIPLVAGIIIQWYYPATLIMIGLMSLSFIISHISFQYLPLAFRFKFQPLQGLILKLIIFTFGMLITYQKDARNQFNWIGKSYYSDDYIIASIIESPVQKEKSFKIEAEAYTVIHNNLGITVTGKLLLYFKKDSSSTQLKYGNLILIHKNIEKIKNARNPGGFNYSQYCAFRQIFHTAYLKRNEWTLLTGEKINSLSLFLIESRKKILSVLKKSMISDDQLSIAEALLIGYTEDIDRDLIKAYSNTGVVHIIAISGMHLGLIYTMLLWVFTKIPYLSGSKVLKICFLLSGLWLFALLTGGCPSILRSAVMFSCIIIGENFSRHSSIYNSLAASAFILLCYNPYYLWDVGFQLSYLSLYGIVIFKKGIYHLIDVQNKWINKIWDLTAVSIAAQVLTFPICLYYFHQFPLFFLITNLITVPLSTIILFVEIFLIGFGWIPLAVKIIGKITWWLILLMNKIILFFNHLPYSVWGNISISVVSTVLIYLIVLTIGYFLLFKDKLACRISLILSCLCTINLAYTKWEHAGQKKIIVYNITKHQAIDFIEGTRYAFIGDSIMEQEGMQQFNLKPARTLYHVYQPLPLLYSINHFYLFESWKILIIDSTMYFQPENKKMEVDLIILSKNANVSISLLTETFNCHNVVLDASNNLWKIDSWKTECERLHLRCHSVPNNGAYIIDL